MAPPPARSSRRQAVLEYFGLVGGPDHEAGKPRPVAWLTVALPLFLGVLMASAHGPVAGVAATVALLPIAIGEWRTAKGKPSLTAGHPYLDALYALPPGVIVLAFIAPSAGPVAYGVVVGATAAISLVIARLSATRQTPPRADR